MARYGGRWAEKVLTEEPFSPLDNYRFIGERLAKNGIKNGTKRRMSLSVFDGGEAELDSLTTYVYQMMVKKRSSEIFLHRVLRPFVYTVKNLEELLPEIGDRIPMAFMYGEFDWVNRDTGDRLIKTGRIQGEVFQTAESGHHLYIEAAEECVACILKF